jgi:hypothetical protein
MAIALGGWEALFNQLSKKDRGCPLGDRRMGEPFAIIFPAGRQILWWV